MRLCGFALRSSDIETQRRRVAKTQNGKVCGVALQLESSPFAKKFRISAFVPIRRRPSPTFFCPYFSANLECLSWLTPEQKSAIQDVMASVQKATADAAGKASGEATKALDDAKKALPN